MGGGFKLRLVSQLSRDMTRVPVREAAFVGLAYLLDNHEEHELLKVLHSKDSLHDLCLSPRVLPRKKCVMPGYCLKCS